MTAPVHRTGLRLALRVEGDFWNAYVAETGSMQNAMLLGTDHGSLAMGLQGVVR